MLRSIVRSSVQRGLHTATTKTINHPSRTGMRMRWALGASMVGGYAVWRLTADDKILRADSEGVTSAESPRLSKSTSPTTASSSSPASSSQQIHSTVTEPPEAAEVSSDPPPESAPDAQDDEGGGGAFNPVTGEINWDCPCLGGMAHGPCGSEFREAFSCFVYSEQEPKGIECVERFRAMQDCFRRHPDVYADEIMDDEEEEIAADGAAPEDSKSPKADSSPKADVVSSATS